MELCPVGDDFYFASFREIYSNKTRLLPPKIILPGKIKGGLHRFDVSESKYGNQNALSPTIFNLLKLTGYVMHQQV